MSGVYDLPKLKHEYIIWGEGLHGVHYRIKIEVVIKSHSIKNSEPEKFTTKVYHT